ncbi:K+ channel tetramerization domain protein [Dictyocaulus viviparus]|uniref:K+ channel tetramerization domain protein n=1 Tax=Dictyocaulus viviparus TaxID=29172 RepID=A0A0D8XHE2_DICVI|nr:K+ channel tetramerization domain protein [Dictyocaulus viviparus]
MVNLHECLHAKKVQQPRTDPQVNHCIWLCSIKGLQLTSNSLCYEEIKLEDGNQEVAPKEQPNHSGMNDWVLDIRINLPQVPEQLKRIYNVQNGTNDISSRGLFDDLDTEASASGSLHPMKRQQTLDTSSSLGRRELNNVASNWIRLNVGGKIFQTTRDTLMKVPGSFLYRLCQDDKRLPSVKDETGAYLIDRDADYFSPVLNYLRHGRLVINPGLADEGVLEEAEFYNLPQLVHLVNERIHEKERNASEVGRFKSVYRVMQCHEEELTTFISGTSDGWKIVQVLPVQTKYQDYNVDRQQEYLCIVVSECPDNGSVSDSRDRATLLQQKARHN